MAEDDDVDVLQASKAKAKASFTPAWHSLLALLQSDEEINRKEIFNRQQVLDEKLETVMTCLDKLSCASKDHGLVSAVTEEIEKISAEYKDAMQQVRLCTISSKSSNSSSAPSTTASKSIISQEGASWLTDKKQTKETEETRNKTEHKENKSRIKSVIKNSNMAKKNDDKGHNSTIGQDTWKQLKRVNIPIFSGDKWLYKNWKASFMAWIDSAPATPEYKLLQLRQYLTRDALKTIKNLGHSAAAYEAARQRLKRKFDGMRRYIAA